MLHIILTILKIIGIILLVIIGLVLLICACILFVPVRYNVRITYKDKLIVNARITYLLHAVSAKYLREGADGNTELRIFGLKTHFFDKDKKEKDRKYEEDTRMFEEMSEQIKDSRILETDNYPTDSKQQAYTEEQDNVQVKKAHSNKIENDEPDRQISNSDIDDGTQDEPYTKEDLRELKGLKRVKKIKFKIKEIIRKIKYRFKKICGTIRKICKSIKDFKAFMSDDKTKKALSLVKKESAKLIKHIKPKKVKGYLVFGFDNPSYTGRLLGIIYMFTKGTRKNFQISPDFENRVFETDVRLKGRIQIYFLLIIAYRFYKDKNFREVLERRRTYGRE